MSEQKNEVEASGPDVESAIDAGLEILGLDRENVIVEVVDEGARGLLGIGSRDAVVRLRSLSAATVYREVGRADSAVMVDEEPAASLEEREEISEANVGQVAADVLQELLDRMQVTATVSASLSEADDLTGDRVHVLDVRGNDLGMLIGSRGETLNALQHVTRLMVGHKIRQRAHFVVDIEGYRKRREQALARLAERMARKVSGRKRPISLEPMPPNERRIIHITLRHDENVYTQSTGEGNRRRVRIFPKSAG